MDAMVISRTYLNALGHHTSAVERLAGERWHGLEVVVPEAK